MFRGYRSSILALAWIVLLSPSEAKPTQVDQYKYAKQNRDELDHIERISVAIEKLAQSPKPDEGCESGQDDRKSDLCAQWKAADAATNSAWWSAAAFWSSIVVAVFSFFALVIAIVAAFYTRRVIDGSERPYLRVKIVNCSFQGFETSNGTLIAQYTIDNIGGSPATIDVIHESLHFEEPEYSKHMDRYLGGSNIYVLDKGDSIGPFAVGDMVPTEGIQANLSAGKSLILRVNFSYFDLYKRRRNVFFKTYYAFGSPYPRFHTNSPPEVIEVPFDRARWHRHLNRIHLMWLKAKMFLRLHRVPPT